MLVSQTGDITTFMFARFCSVILVAPATLIPGVMVTIAGGWLGKTYLKAQLSVKREMSNAQSPILSHFSAALAGLVSIRAYGAQTAIKRESFVRIDKYTRTSRAFNEVNRWMSVRIETMGAVFAAGIAAYLVYGRTASASNTGFALNMAVGFCDLIRHCIYAVNSMEVQANSLERIQQYLEIEHEPKATPDGVPPAYWPASGKLSVETLSAKYSEDGPKVLRDLNFTIKSGERVGIVGRTGSGKSSLTLALLRCILTEGKVYLDGLPTDSVNLSALRSSITIIPQVPELLSGTLRQNLDPFGEYDDAVLNDSLRAAGLFSLQHSEDDARLTLDSAISSGGGNLSVGQRQILALARAMVRRSKLLILDEATSAIDNETDNVIQASLRNELGKDVTLLTVAHRLQTIMDADKIMVLDAGNIVEFGEPGELLNDEAGLFRALVDGSGDKDTLYTMAKRSG
ncbi:P-loop containing nucleoside triphosphate hydrolase protein [Cristinia sonorae]|uniref:P-loop containing nucleoside triphosphate hydrolase protein n=1 Tax=Cristinia sonorae TaxID=1940300 RepID=A0A8K0UDT9_9AGAR|nr:P-loop containing nucleoside triphosphate hydrolase protein [Cristinia sonorae]